MLGLRINLDEEVGYLAGVAAALALVPAGAVVPATGAGTAMSA